MPTHLDTARFVVANPQHYADRPHLFTYAWVELKRARGQSLNRDTLGPSRHHDSIRPAAPPDAPLVARLDAARARTSRTVRAIIAGRATPEPEGAA